MSGRDYYYRNQDLQRPSTSRWDKTEAVSNDPTAIPMGAGREQNWPRTQTPQGNRHSPIPSGATPTGSLPPQSAIPLSANAMQYGAPRIPPGSAGSGHPNSPSAQQLLSTPRRNGSWNKLDPVTFLGSPSAVPTTPTGNPAFRRGPVHTPGTGYIAQGSGYGTPIAPTSSAPSFSHLSELAAEQAKRYNIRREQVAQHMAAVGAVNEAYLEQQKLEFAVWLSGIDERCIDNDLNRMRQAHMKSTKELFS